MMVKVLLPVAMRKKQNKTKRVHREIYSPIISVSTCRVFNVLNSQYPPPPHSCFPFIILFFVVVAPCIFKFSFSFFRKKKPVGDELIH
jgi:hypothetical protein